MKNFAAEKLIKRLMKTGIVGEDKLSVPDTNTFYTTGRKEGSYSWQMMSKDRTVCYCSMYTATELNKAEEYEFTIRCFESEEQKAAFIQKENINPDKSSIQYVKYFVEVRIKM